MRKLLRVLAVVAVLAVAVQGVLKRNTYTDKFRQPESLDDAYVAELPEEIAFGVVERMQEELPDASMIVRVKATGNSTVTASYRCQEAVVMEVYQGKNIHEGDIVQIVKDGTPYNFSEEEYGKDWYSISLGFVNLMNADEQYLVFLDRQMDSLQGRTDLYCLTDQIISSYFSYEQHTNEIVPIEPDAPDTYVKYKQVCNNEFFMASEEAERTIRQLKDALIEQYPK